MTRISVRHLADPSDEDMDTVIQLLMEAFKDDVGMASLSGSSARVQTDIFRRTIRACVDRGQIHVGTVDNRIKGVAAWIAPGEDWQCYLQDDFLGILSPYLREWYTFHYAPTYEELYNAAFASGDDARRNAWNLKFLAVHPDAQRDGLGKLLLNTLCKQADTGGRRILTDVKSPYHVQWFRKSNFTHRAVKNFTSKDSAGFPLWCMARDPASSADARR